MKLHPEELVLARAFSDGRPFEGLTTSQLQSIQERAKTLHRWMKSHPLAHSAISLAVLAFLFSADFWILLRLPALLLGDALAAGQTPAWTSLLLAGVVAGSLHSYLLYSLAFYTMHDGYSHKVIFPMTSKAGRAAHFVASNLCRLASAEPQFFAKYHLPHHLKFGTEEDGEFLNFVIPRRYWLSLLPLAAITNFNDFLIHRPPTYTPSRLVSVALALTYNGVYAFFMAQAFGWIVALTMLVLMPHVGFYFDRLRQFTEHNLMPLDNTNGARSLGLGFWGLLLGGGPWGSPCHLEHHLAVGLPWYGQLMLHTHLRSILTPQQRKQFLLQPVVGWPKLWWAIMRDAYAFRRRAVAGGGGA